MRKATVLLPHFLSPEWIAIAVHAFQTYGSIVEAEIVVINNSPDSPSIKSITETSLGEGVKIVDGRSDFQSHAYAYKLGYDQTDSEWIFTAESDSFPTRHGWFEEYIKASPNYDLIGPEMPMAAGTFIHPAGSLVRRKLLEVHKGWSESVKDWKFVPSAAIEFGLSDKAYHVIVSDEFLRQNPVCISTAAAIHLWSDVGPWQEMRSFDDDSFSTYGQRKGITNWQPIPGRQSHLRIGYEPGQNLSYFAQSHGFRILKAPTHIQWMPGLDGRQAAYSTVFGGFTHVWCGTSSTQPGITPEVREFKIRQRDELVAALPEDVKKKISQLRAEHP